MGKKKNVELVKKIADVLGVTSKDLSTDHNVYVLLDRSGSMGSNWVETIGSVNTYIEKLDKDVNVYFAVFDCGGFDVVREGKAGSIKPVTTTEVTARGSTPLYDAAARVMNRILADAPARAVFTVMTDGMENASREYNLPQVRELMDKLKAKDYATVFLGASFSEVTAYTTATFNLDSGNSAFVTRGLYNTAACLNSTKTMNYFNEAAFTTASASAMLYSEDEKEELAGNKTLLSETGDGGSAV